MLVSPYFYTISIANELQRGAASICQPQDLWGKFDTVFERALAVPPDQRGSNFQEQLGENKHLLFPCREKRGDGGCVSADLPAPMQRVYC